MDPFQKLIQLFQTQSQHLDHTTQIHLLVLNCEEFKYSIVRNSLLHTKSTKKTYRIQLKPNALIFKTHLLAFINKFSIRKFILNLDANSLNSQNQWQIIKEIYFQQVKINHQDKRILQQKKQICSHKRDSMILQKIEIFFIKGPDFDSLEIQLESSLNVLFKLIKLTDILEKKCVSTSQQSIVQSDSHINKSDEKYKELNQNTKYKFYFHLDILQHDQLLKLIENWCGKNVSCCERLKKQSHSAVSAFPRERLFSAQRNKILESSSLKIDPTILRHLRNEVITIYFQTQHVLSMTSCKDYGYNINLGRQLSRKQHVQKIIDMILCSRYFISLQILSHHDNLLSILGFIFQHHGHHSNYLIKIGNQVELTSFRLMLNTKNVEFGTVLGILNLLRLPGHYQLVFYGSIEYLVYVQNLFVKKPFTKFNYFLPIEQVSAQIELMISKMQKKADDFKTKVFQFGCLLKDFSFRQLHLIEDVFVNMHVEHLSIV